MKYIFTVLALVIVSGLLGWMIALRIGDDQQARWSSSVLLEAVRSVDKVVLVEGDLNELFRYGNSSYLDSWPFQKEVLLKLTGTASVGYNLATARIELFPEAHRLKFSMDTIPRLISLSHEVAVVHIEEDWFNTFGEDDWTAVHRSARKHLEQRCLQDRLYQRARQRLEQKLAQIDELCQTAGWTFDFNHSLNKRALARASF